MSAGAERQRGGSLLWAAPLLFSVLAGLVFAIAHASGWREHTSILSGTIPGAEGSVGQGLFYVAAWFAWVVLAPIGVLSAAIYALLSRRLSPALAPADSLPRQGDRPQPPVDADLPD